jgi:hypothetical protein
MESIVRTYCSQDAEVWNATNAEAVNGHFLFDRRFMEYHSHRFSDASLLVEEEGVAVGLLPANRVQNVVYSHQGLTFGGLVLKDSSTTDTMRRLDAVATYLARQGANKLTYKALPAIYRRQPANADLYWLFQQNASLVRRDVTTTIDFREPGSYSSRRLRGIKKSQHSAMRFGPSEDVEGFWHLLRSVLYDRHGVQPVHSCEELRLLKERLPQHINLFTATRAEELLAGVLIFNHALVAHAQYIAASEAGRKLGALDGLFDLLINTFRETKRFFDFGISTEESGRMLNVGLVTQKEEFGGSATTHDVYELDLTRF